MNSRFTLTISFLLMLFSSTQAQDVCGTDYMVNKALSENPAIEAEYQQFEAWVQENQELFEASPDGGTYIVPVVVHIIHNYGAENISQAQVEDAIRILNEDFQKDNDDTSDVVAAFKPVIGNAGFEFRLAKKDPNGNCTNGITRTVSALTYDAGDNVKSLISWPRSKYFNVWIVNSIYSSDQSLGITAGYAYLPGTAPSAAEDGVLIDHRYFGSIGASNGSDFAKRTFTHETGHFFGLLHPWGNQNCGGNCGNDQVNDTPTTSGSCSTCNLSQSTCSNDGLDNIQNYMDYALCSRMFTAGQCVRMETAINSTTGSRSSLWQASNLTATGTTNGFVNNCAPVADFKANRLSICAGDPVTFTDLSWNATATSWAWTFTNGINTLNSNQQNPIVNFPNPGIYEVTLTATSVGGNNTKTKTQYLHVFPETPEDVNWIYYDAFDNGPIANSRWKVLYAENPATGWQETQLASYSAPNSLRINNFNGTPGKTYNIISPSYDFSNIEGVLKFTYKIAYANRTSGMNVDKLNVYISSNCGSTWSLRKTYENADLTTTTTQPTSWAPTSLAQWRTDSIGSLTPWASKDNVRLRFEFISGGGNNFYLDDVNIESLTGIENLDKETLGMRVFPNPTSGSFTLFFGFDESFDVNISVQDVTGRTVLSKPMGMLGPELYEIPLTMPEGITSGIYFVNINIGGRTYVEKIIIE